MIYWKEKVDKVNIFLKSNDFIKAKQEIRAGLEKFPNQTNLLTIATEVYRSSGDREKSLDLSELLIKHHPANWNGYVRGAQDLIALQRFDEAEKLITQFRGKDIDASSKIKFNLKRRKLISTFSKAMNVRSGREYPTFCVAGNCQSDAFYKWLSKNFPYCEISKLKNYQSLNSQSEIDDWIEKAIKSDFVIMIKVRDDYGGFKFGSNFIRSLLSKKTKFILYPNFHLEVFYPFFGYAKNKKQGILRGKDIKHLGHKHGDYHDFLAMLLSSKEKDAFERFCKKIRIIQKSANYSSNIIRKLGTESFKHFEKRNPNLIEIVKTDMSLGINPSFNHPRISTLNMIYKIIWEKEFGLDINDFIELDGRFFEGRNLPIPEFVSKSILSKGNDVPWENIDADNFLHKHEDLEDYLVSMNNDIKFYRENPEIITWNTNSKKLQAAQTFLDEISI